MEYVPQAYTKDTLVKAFEWLQNQPESVKELAHSPDTLIALYAKSLNASLGLKAKPTQTQNEDTPLSSKQFITELKELATGLEEFNGNNLSGSLNKRRTVTQPLVKEPTVTPATKDNSIPTFKEPTPVPIGAVNKEWTLDAKTMQIVLQVQARFNLSTPQEAIRLLVSVGNEKLSHWTI